MRAAVYEEFRSPLIVSTVPDPTPRDDGIVLEVRATGVCRSDWHGWMGHDRDIVVPHVPGHEMAGVIAAVGKDVRQHAVGERVTLPFVCGCGDCEQCASGNQQVCDHQSQPGFTHWGCYAEFVAVHYADGNLVKLPDDVDVTTAASLGCRFATAFRAVVDQGRVRADQWVAVHGCGGVGLSAVMIAAAFGARVVAIDIDAGALAEARDCGADALVDATSTDDVAAAILDITSGGAHLSVDALGAATISEQSIASLRKLGKHIQVGLMVGSDSRTEVAMDRIIANELEILGSHGMQAHRYPEMLAMVADGQLDPARLVTRTVDLDTAAAELAREDYSVPPGVTVIDRFAGAE